MILDPTARHSSLWRSWFYRCWRLRCFRTSQAQTEFYEQLADLQIAVLHTCSYADSHQTAFTQLVHGDFAPAVSSLESELRTNPNPSARKLLGLTNEATGHLPAASEQFRLAAPLNPQTAAPPRPTPSPFYSREIGSRRKSPRRAVALYRCSTFSRRLRQ